MVLLSSGLAAIDAVIRTLQPGDRLCVVMMYTAELIDCLPGLGQIWDWIQFVDTSLQM